VSAPDTAQFVALVQNFRVEGDTHVASGKILQNAGDKPEKSKPGEGSSLTTGSKLEQRRRSFGADQRHELRMLQLTPGIPGHRIRRHAIQAVLRMPGLRLEAAI